MVTKVREIREKLIDLQVEIANLMEEPTDTYRELDIISQKLEEAIMWTYRVVGLEKFDSLKKEDTDIKESENENFDIDKFIEFLVYFNKNNFKD